VFLSGLLDILEAGLMLLQSTISGGMVKTWAGRFKALVDGPAEAVVHGSAFRVDFKEHEEELLFYETEKHEVTRCTIMLGTEDVIQGCTFRFLRDWGT